MDKDRFKQLRTGLGLSQPALAERMGMSVVHISRIENGHSPLSKGAKALMALMAIEKIVDDDWEQVASDRNILSFCREALDG